MSNFVKETDDIINGIGITPQEPEISEEVKGLKAGDYIKYDSGENGIITCRVLYTADSPYGLQIISDKNVGEEITLGGNNWEEGKASYNGAIETLNKEAEKYVNPEYACDGRCVGSIPTVQNGMFVDKNKVRDSEGNIRVEIDTAILPPTTWKSYTKPTDWVSNDTECYNTDTNYTIDEIALKKANIWTIGENYWLATRAIRPLSSDFGFYVRNVISDGDLDWFRICGVQSDGNTYGRSLKANVIKITQGNGTEESPYVIGK